MQSILQKFYNILSSKESNCFMNSNLNYLFFKLCRMCFNVIYFKYKLKIIENIVIVRHIVHVIDKLIFVFNMYLIIYRGTTSSVGVAAVPLS